MAAVVSHGWNKVMMALIAYQFFVLACGVGGRTPVTLKDKIEILPGGHVAEQKEQQNQRLLRWQATEEANIDATGKKQLCKSLTKVMIEKQCGRRGLALLQEHGGTLIKTSEWPDRDCALPRPWVSASHASSVLGQRCVVALASSTANVESIWSVVPAGSVVVAPLQLSSRSVNSDAQNDPEGLIWQAMYRIHTNLNSSKEFDTNFDRKLGLADLQFATFSRGYAMLQKAGELDLHASNGTFWMLSKEAKTDKIDVLHNYSLLYHRHFDGTDLFREGGGMMLEVGLGCLLERGNASLAGQSAQLWPRLFPRTAVHFIEIDRECVANWMPNMRKLGVTKIHIGAQADPSVLKAVIHDASFASLRSVIDDGSHNAADIEITFRALFPHIKPGGLYFVEDIMHSAWPTYRALKAYPSMQIRSKRDHSSGTPVALAAVLAAAATGLAELPPEAGGGSAEILEKIAAQARPAESENFFGRVAQRTRAMISYMMEPFVKPDFPSPQYPDDSVLDRNKWRQEILSSAGGLVDFVECTPGICAFRHK